jgi:uncharacterized protein
MRCMQRMISFFPPESSIAPEDEWVCTRSGRKFFPLDPRPDQVSIGDIAYGLAGKYRFGAQSPRRYTVAQHCVEVCRQLAREGAASDACLWGLLHDAAEAWLVDWQRPVKWRQLWWDGEQPLPFAAIELKILCTVQQVFSLADDYLVSITSLSKQVDAADRAQLLRERRDLFAGEQPEWPGLSGVSDELPLLEILAPDEAEKEFLYEFWLRFNAE